MGLQVPCLPVYRRCCCFSVRTGTLILGWLNMVLLVAVFVLSCVGIAVFQVILDNNDQMMMSRSEAERLAWVFSRKWLRLIIFNMVLAMVLCMVEGTLCALMLHGVHKGKPSFMLPKLTTSVVAITMSMFTTVYYFIVSLYGFNLFWLAPGIQTMAAEHSGVPIAIFPVALAVSGVMIPVGALALYFWNVMYSHYRHLEESRGGLYTKMDEITV